MTSHPALAEYTVFVEVLALLAKPRQAGAGNR